MKPDALVKVAGKAAAQQVSQFFAAAPRASVLVRRGEAPAFGHQPRKFEAKKFRSIQSGRNLHFLLLGHLSEPILTPCLPKNSDSRGKFSQSLADQT